MVNILPRKNGYTLIELLIASTIFAIVMILSVAAISQTGSYQIKLKESRNTADNVRKIADMLTRDIKDAKGGGSATFTDGAESHAFDRGVFLAKCSVVSGATSCQPKYFNSPSGNGASSFAANTLVLFSSDSVTVYYANNDTDTSSNAVYVKKYVASVVNGQILLSGNSDPVVSIATLVHSIIDPQNDIIPEKDTANTVYAAINFGGFTPSKDSTLLQQPYVSFDITSKTLNYDAKLPGQRSMAEIQSAVTVRNYK